MKNLIFILLLIVFPKSLNAQPYPYPLHWSLLLEQMQITQIDPINNPGLINVHTKVALLADCGYISSSYNIVGNSINLDLCFWFTDFDAGGGANIQRDNLILLPSTTGNWILKVRIFCSSNLNVCDYYTLDEDISVNFSMPLTIPFNYNTLANESFENSNFQLSPNPTTGVLNINFNELQDNISVSITNFLGQIISTKKYAVVEQITTEITTEKGIYFVTIENENHEKKTVKIVKQ